MTGDAVRAASIIPSFISREDARSYFACPTLSNMMAVTSPNRKGFVGAGSFVAYCATKGRPIRSVLVQDGKLSIRKYRVLDVIARAHSEAREVLPPAPPSSGRADYLNPLAERQRTLMEEIVALRELRDSMTHEITSPLHRQSEVLTGKTLLTREEIVAAATKHHGRVAGVYFLVDEGAVVYVGQSTNVLGRIGQHLREKRFDSYAFIACDQSILTQLEALYIHLLRPILNRDINGKLFAPNLDGVLVSEARRAGAAGGAA